MQDGLKRLENALDSEEVLRALDVSTLSIQPGEPATGAIQATQKTSKHYCASGRNYKNLGTCAAFIDH